MTKGDTYGQINQRVFRHGKGHKKKPRQVRVYLSAENQVMLRDLAERIADLSESQIVSLLVSAGLRAAKENDYKLHLPIKMEIHYEGDK